MGQENTPTLSTWKESALSLIDTVKITHESETHPDYIRYWLKQYLEDFSKSCSDISLDANNQAFCAFCHGLMVTDIINPGDYQLLTKKPREGYELISSKAGFVKFKEPGNIPYV